MNDSPPDDSRLGDPEARMRRALGLDRHPSPLTERDPPISKLGDLHSQRRQFVRDGEVPVTIVHRLQNPDAESTNQLDAARQAIRTHAAAKERAERLLEQAQVQVRGFQTKLAHERLAKDEAVGRANADRRSVEQALQAVRTELSAEKIARERSEQASRDAQVTIGNLTEKLHAAQQGLTTAKAELAARTAQEVGGRQVAGDGEETARKTIGRSRKPSVVVMVEKSVRQPKPKPD